MSRPAGFRFPFEPLDRMLGGDTEYVASRLGVSCDVVKQARRFGLTEPRADLLATRAGYHPGDIWPYWWLDDIGRMFARLRERSELQEAAS